MTDQDLDGVSELSPPGNEAHHSGSDCCSGPAQSDDEFRPLSARAARNPNLTKEEREAAEAEAAEWARVSNRC